MLITGPPASGKSRAAMDRFRAASDSLLIVPSATMAEHAAHEMARAGEAVRPGRVITLADFLSDRAAEPPPKFLLHLAIEEALEHQRPPRFASVVEYRGFRESLARLMEESAAGVLPGDLRALFEEVERRLAARGFASRKVRLTQAAENGRALPSQIVFDGFFSFSHDELQFLTDLAARTSVTATLPDWPDSPRSALLAAGFREHCCHEIFRRPVSSIFAAPNLEGEVHEIARRILEESRRGRPFREIGILLRAREPYGPALETVLARFGIPARLYFSGPLIQHPVIGFLAAIARALAGGWDHEALLELAAMPISGLGMTMAGDRFDYELRKRLPGTGLPLRSIEDPPPLLRSLAAIDSWRREVATARAWADRLKSLVTLAPEPAVGDVFSRDELRFWRSTAAATGAYMEQADQVAAALGSSPVSFAEFWTRAEAALTVEELRVADRRRDAVHVLDVFEARQWELPVVFVCGLAEGHFPRHHGEDPLLDDAARRRAGLRTSQDLQNQESSLFAWACSRATEKTILSYARFNEKGDEAVPSLFLEQRPAEPCPARIYPRPSRPISAARPVAIREPSLLANLGRLHQALAPTSIESFLQCPFQFFAGKTLRLVPLPKAPRERLDLLLQGSILHRALAELARAPLLGVAVFDEVFDQECREARIPPGYRMEAVRLEMRRNFEMFLADRRAVAESTSRVEEKFRFALTPQLALRGRIDRIDLAPGGRAVVIDYKYSAAHKIRERIKDETGNQVQGGLYLLAAERHFGLKPAGMLFCGFRKGVEWGGWHLPIRGLEDAGETVGQAVLDEMTRAAAAKAVETFEAIASGKIAVQPADEAKCVWCDFRDICRVEAATAGEAATA